MSEVKRDSQAKNKILAGILGVFLGAFGLHKFVLGYKMEGLIMLLTSILSGGTLAPVVTIVGLIEGLIYSENPMRISYASI